MFNLSLLSVLPYKPWRWVDEQAGTKQTLNGVFILFSEQLVTMLKQSLTQAEKDELDQWVNRYTEAQCAQWHVPVWAGNDSAVYCRVPATVWNDPSTPPPTKVKRYFASLWRES